MKVKTETFEDAFDAVSDFVLEEMAGGVALAQTAGAYDRVCILQDDAFRPAKVLAKIRELAPDYVLDIHLLCHGGKERFIGGGGKLFDESSFFEPLMQERASGETPLFLRAVYQMNCRGGTLKDDWQALGAEVVNGTIGAKDNYMPHQYFFFMKFWIQDGMTFHEATSKAYAEAKKPTGPVYEMFLEKAAQRIEDSRLTVVGDGGTRLVSP